MRRTRRSRFGHHNHIRTSGQPSVCAKLKTAIEGAWKGSYKDPKTGAVYKVSTTAEVSVYDPMRGSGLSARNGFYVGITSHAAISRTAGRTAVSGALPRRPWHLHRCSKPSG